MDPAADWEACPSVGTTDGANKVAVDTIAAGCCAGTGIEVAAGAHAANSTANRLRVIKRRVFTLVLCIVMILERLYQQILTKGLTKPHDIRHFDGL